MAEELPIISQRLRKAREKAGLTQMQLAVAAGVNVSLITHIEQGRTADPRWNTVQAIARALGVSLDELAGKGNAP